VIHSEFHHTSVLLNESVNSLLLKQGDYAFDCTAGAGGHSALMHSTLGDTGQLICMDRDAQAINYLKNKFENEIQAKKIIVIKSPFSKIKQIAVMLDIVGKVSGILADIGVSSPQLDQAERGFSFMKNGPLDMRMDQNTGESAADVVHSRSERELQMIFQEFGEEKYSRRIAQAIVRERIQTPILTTQQLSDIIKKAVPPHEQQKHPATRVFQALRIYVNHELDELKEFLVDSFYILKPKGRLSVITFHSLEDRIVKTFFKDKGSKSSIDPMFKHLPIMDSDIKAEGKIIKPFPLLPSEEEILQNVRSRSAKLRVIEKL
jgi:16S rRNA (cytosine1402-N4)-methyltransferase